MALLKGERISGYDPKYSAASLPALPRRPGESGRLWQTPPPRFDRNNTPRVIAGGSEYSGVWPDLQRHSAASLPALPGRQGESGRLWQTSHYPASSRPLSTTRSGEVSVETASIVGAGKVHPDSPLGMALLERMAEDVAAQYMGDGSREIDVVYLSRIDPSKGVIWQSGKTERDETVAPLVPGKLKPVTTQALVSIAA